MMGDTEKTIFKAVGRGDLATVMKMVNESRIDVNSRIANSLTLLMKASAKGHYPVVKYLVDKGADVNLTDRGGYTALLWAVDKHIAKLNTVQYLVDHGANINIRDRKEGYSPLHWITKHGNLEIAKYLLEKGARIEVKTYKGETPAHLAAASNGFTLLEYYIDKRGAHFDIFEAAQHGYTNAVKYFIERKKKSANAFDQSGWTTLHRAAFGGHMETVKYLVEKKAANVNAKNNQGRTPATALHAATERGHKAVIIYLVENGAEVNARDSNGRTPLFWASSGGQLDLVKYFIDTLNSDPNGKDSSGKMLLHAACASGNVGVIRYLVEEKRLNANSQDEEGRTPLIECIQKPQLDASKYLIKFTNVTLVDKTGSNVLHYAAGKADVTTIKELVNQQGDYQLANLKGQKPFDFASQAGRLEIVKYFIDDLGVPYSEEIFDACEEGYLGLVMYLIEVKMKHQNDNDEEGWTLLQRAASKGQLPVIKYLVETIHVDVNAKNSLNKSPFTALHAACFGGHLETVKYLIHKGADMAATGTNGRTPLYEATQAGVLPMVKYFFDVKKADPRQINQVNGNTLLHAAAESSNLDLIKYLISDKGLDINRKNNDGHTPLFKSLIDSNIVVFNYLLTGNSAEFRAPDSHGRTCLHEAAFQGLIVLVKTLVQKGADLNAKDENGKTPVFSTVAGAKGGEGDHLNIVKYFVDEKKVDVFQRDKHFNTLLQEARAVGAADIIKYLVGEKKFEPDEKDKEGNTPLHKAVQEGDLSTVKTLYKKGADINMKNREDMTPIFSVASGQHLDILRYFLDEVKVDVNQKDVKGNTLLHVASSAGVLDTVNYLIDKKQLNVNEKNNKGETSLHKAAWKGHLIIVETLIKKGADISAKNEDGMTPVSSAIYGGNTTDHLNVVRYFVNEKKVNVLQRDKLGNTLLQEAQHAGASNIVKYLMDEKKLLVDEKDKEGNTPLHRAAREGNLTQVKSLFEKGADINIQNEEGITPFFSATYAQHPDVLQYFVDEMKLDVTQKDVNGNALLHTASDAGTLDIVNYLIDKKQLAVNETNNDGEICLHKAALKGHLTTVKLLIEKGAQIDAANKNGRTPVSYATYGPRGNNTGHLDVVKYFLDEKKADKQQKDTEGNTLLHIASEAGALEVVEYLIDEKELRPNEKNNMGETCLHKAAWTGQMTVVQKLIEKGGDIAARNEKGRTPVSYSAYGPNGNITGHLNLVKYFVEDRKADLHQRDHNGYTLLHNSIWNKAEIVAKWLVEEKGMNPNEKDKDGDTSLHKAAWNGLPASAKLFVEKGADIDVRNRNGKTPVFYAARGGNTPGHLAVLKYFVEEKNISVYQTDRKGHTILHQACLSGSVAIIKYLTEEKGLDVNERDNDGNTCLHKASSNGQIEAVELLIGKRMDINARNNEGDTPLHTAVWNGQLPTVKILVEKGADMDSRNTYGRTPVYSSVYAQRNRGRNGYLNILRYFLDEKHANIKQTDNGGNSLLDQAAFSNVLDVAKYLVEEKGVDLNSVDNGGVTPLGEAQNQNKWEVAKYLESKGARLSRGRRDVSSVFDQPNERSFATNSAYRHYSLISSVTNYAKNLLISSSEAKEGALSSKISFGFLNEFLVLCDLGYKRYFGGRNSDYKSLYAENLLSPSQIVERRMDTEAVIAVYDSQFFKDESI